MALFIDYTTVIDVEKRAGKYIGAGNFARGIIASLKEAEVDFKVIIDTGYLPKDESESKLLSSLDYYCTSEIGDVPFLSSDILFLPVVNGYLLDRIHRIKAKFGVSVYAVVHDRRHNLVKYDPWDVLYFKGLNRNKVVNYVGFNFKHFVYNLMYPKWIRSIDKLFTVSNYSLQSLVCGGIKMANYFYQQSTIAPSKNDYSAKYSDLKNYILFVSGGRCEKNFARALYAFYLFKTKQKDNSDCMLCVTGIDKDTFCRISERLKISQSFIHDYVRSLDYVTTDELAFLYAQCRYLIFVSKGEGFGLPILEAMEFGKTSLASWQTSIPEVAGSILYYVDAYNVESMVNGMEYLSKDKNIKYRESLVERKRKIVKEQIILDREVFINEIMEK